MKTNVKQQRKQPVSPSQVAANAQRLITEQAPSPDSAPTMTNKTLLLCSLATSLLLYLSFFPVGWGFLGWFSLVPLLVLVRAKARPRAIALFAYLSGIVFYFPVLQWLRVADPMMTYTWLLLTIYCSLYIPVTLWLVRRLERVKMPLVVSLPIAWVGMEYIRSTILWGGFAWYLQASTQQAFLPLIQMADLGGIYLVSFLVVMVNAIAFEWLFRSQWFQSRWGSVVQSSPTSRVGLVFQTVMVLLLFTAGLGYGSWRMSHTAFAKGPKLALIQGNVSQGVRNASADDTGAAKSILKHYMDLSIIAARQHADMMVWPETSWPIEWNQAPEHLLSIEEKQDQDLLRQIPIRSKTPLLVGLNVQEWEGKKRTARYNSAMLVDDQGKILGRYDKIHRVVFGEFVPFRHSLPWLNNFSPYDYDYSIEKGKEQDRLPLGKYRFGVVICYEDTNPVLPRGYVAGESKVDFLINISNDGWFRGTSEHEEHLGICRFRAIECRRAVVRSVNLGISGIFDSNGRLLAPKEANRTMGLRTWVVPTENAEELPVREWHRFKSVAGVLVAEVPIDNRGSLYARFGDWLPGLCWLLLSSVLLFQAGSRLRRRSQKTTLVEGATG